MGQSLHDALQEHAGSLRKRRLRQLFQQAPDRFERFSLYQCGILLDYSKNYLDDDTLKLLSQFAEQNALQASIGNLFAGKVVNPSYELPALHHVLRSPKPNFMYAGVDIKPGIDKEFSRLAQFADDLNQQRYVGSNGNPITDIVHIGIGGSELGPRLVNEALADYHCSDINIHFVSNLDPAHMQRILAKLNPASSLFCIASKSFRTQETLANLQLALNWLPDTAVAKHVVAVTENSHAAAEYGIRTIFNLWPWLGGRFSVWSSISLPVITTIGAKQFQEFLNGAHSMDEHFQSAPLTANMPIIMALLDFWYQNFFPAQSKAIIPYSHALKALPAYLQQLHMESLGKHITHDNEPCRYVTGDVTWGEIGSNGQHSFHQLFAQGMHFIPIDFITIAKNTHPHHEALYRHCVSQSHSLMWGEDEDDAIAYLQSCGVSDEKARRFAKQQKIPGNQASNTLVLDELTPKTLGALIALYEHKIYAQASLLKINPFDQPGVEFGKRLQQSLEHQQLDGSTHGLLQHQRTLNARSE